jgi:hypothetical protein
MYARPVVNFCKREFLHKEKIVIDRLDKTNFPIQNHASMF